MGPESTQYRIGAVSSLSGVPVPTLRVWESRYGAFQPAKTDGSHRLYQDDDVLRATLLRQLTEAGHAISTVARLDATALSGLLHQQRSSQQKRQAGQGAVRQVSLAVVDLTLAARVQSATFQQRLTGVSVRVTDALSDLETTAGQGLTATPDILLVRVNSLHMASHASLRRLIQQHRIAQVIVLYSFGQERVVQAMKLAGMIVRREPVSESELADLVSSVLLVDAPRSVGLAQPGGMIPPRKYTDETLQRMAAISSQVLCECPRHVAELIAQLASFEQYSQECLNNSVQDATLHAHLSAISGSARAMFERALEMVAEHEGIALDPR